MKLKNKTLAWLLALGAAAALPMSSAQAASAANGDILVGFRATGGTGSTKNLVVNIGAATALESATGTVNLGNINADLTATYGSGWATRNNLFWGAVGTVGSFNPIGTNPARTVYGSRRVNNAWLRANDSSQASVTNKVRGLMTAFDTASSADVTHPNGVVQTTSEANHWASYQPGGIVENAGPAPGISFAFFNPDIENTFENGAAAAALYLYRVKPASGAAIGTPGDYLGQLLISSGGALTFQPDLSGPPTITFSQDTYTIEESGGNVLVTLSRGGQATPLVDVTIAATGGTALSGTDFTALASSTVSFGSGETEKTVNLGVLNRTGIQGPRTVILSISNPTNGGVIGVRGSTTVTINDTIITSTVQLVNATQRVNAESASAVIQLSRSGGTDPVDVFISTTNGTAVGGTDFTAPIAETRVSFAQGATTATCNLPLINPSMPANRNFTVSISRPGDAPSYLQLGTVTTMTVTLLAQDALAPTISFVAPLANARIPESAGTNVQVSLRAQDNVALDRVEVSLNGGSFQAANLSGGNYLRSVTATPGINVVTARALDFRGNTTTITRQFIYVLRGNLNVVTDAIRGTLSRVTPLGSTVPVLAGAFETGTTYVVKATAKPGFTFSGWTVPGLALDAPATRLPTLVFVYNNALRTATPPTITANFVATPFTDARIGDYHGLVTADTGFAASNSSTGFMKLSLTKTGTFTGSIQIDGFRLNLPAGGFTSSGVAFFGTSETATVRVERGTKPAIELTQLSWNQGASQVTGVITLYYRRAVASRSIFTLKRAAFSATNRLAANSPYLANRGLHSVIIPNKEQTNGLAREDYPVGSGVGSITITNAGVATFTGRLADDTTITASVPLNAGAGSTLEAPFFSQLYNTRGSFSGLVVLDSTQADSDMKAVDCLWFRPWQNGVQWYPWGWEEGLEVDLYAANYNPTRAGGVLPGLPILGASGNANIVFNGGLLENEVVARIGIPVTGALTRFTVPGAAASTSFTATLAAPTGAITGTFTHEDSTKPNYFVQIYQKGPNAGAYGYFLSTRPRVLDGNGQSGSVEVYPAGLVP